MESIAGDATRSGRLPLMDGLRGIAALVVMTRHTAEFWPFVLYRSYLAVDVFFLLSGFVIARAYGERLQAGKLSVGQFMVIRLVRLYPMYLLSALVAGVAFVLMSVGHGQFGAMQALTVVFMLFMLPFKLPGYWLLFPLHGAYWSLLFEIIVNYFYARLVRLLSARKMFAVIGVAAAVLVAAGLKSGGLDLGFNWGVTQIIGGSARAVFGIFLGAMLERHGATWGVARAIRARPWLAFTAIVLLLVSPSLGALNGLVDLVIVLGVFPVCVLALDAPVSNAFVARGLMFLGAASYPLYVLHGPVAGIVRRCLAPWMEAHSLLIGIVFTLILVVLCIALERFVDEPIRRSLRRYIADAAARRRERAIATAEIALVSRLD